MKENEPKFYRYIDKRNGDCVGVMGVNLSAMAPFQEFLFLDPEPYEVVNDDLTGTVETVKPIDFLQIDQQECTREEAETLLEFHRAAGEVYLK